MPKRTVVDIPAEAQAQMRIARRRARDGSVLGRHLVGWGAAGRHPTDIAAVLVGSRARGSRTVRADRAGTLGRASDAAGRRRRTTGSLGWWSTRRGTTPPPWSHGSPRSRALSGAGGRPLAPAPIPSRPPCATMAPASRLARVPPRTG
jgi:hypothetical protein